MQPKRLCFLSILFLSMIGLTGALWLESNEATALSQRATVFLDAGQYDSALVYYLKSEKILLQHSTPQQLADIKNSIAEVYRLLGDSESANAYANEVLEICSGEIPGNSETLAKAYETLGKVNDYIVRDFETARQHYEKALSVRKLIYGEEHPSIAECYFLVGRTFLNIGNHGDAASYFKRAENMKKRLLGPNDIAMYDLFLSEAALNRRIARFEEALRYYSLAREVWKVNDRSEDHPNFGLLAYGVGNLFFEQGQYESSIGEYKVALKNFEKFYGANDFHVAITYQNIGAAYSKQLDLDLAEQYYAKGLRVLESIMEPNHPFICILYIEFCDLYYTAGKFEKAVEFGEKGVELLISRYGNQPIRELGVAYGHTATALQKAQRNHEALEMINKSIAVFEKIDDKYVLCNAYVGRGIIYEALEEFDLSHRSYLAAINLFGKDDVNLHLAYAYGNFADLAVKQKDFNKALELANKGLMQLGVEFSNPYDLPSLDSLYTVDYITGLLPTRGESLLGIFDDFNDANALFAALHNYESLTDVYQHIIRQNKAERSKLLQLANMVVYYEKAVQCALELYELTNDIAYKYKAFEFSEQSKGVLLLQYVHETKAKNFAGIPEDVGRSEHKHKETINSLEASLTRGGEQDAADSSIATIRQKLFEAKVDYEGFLHNIERDYPQYYELKYKRPDLRTEDVMKLLEPRQAILEYLIGERRIYLFLLTANAMDVIAIEGTGEPRQHADSIKSSLANRDREAFTKHAFAFYQQMVRPASEFLDRHGITNITIIPDGFASYVPFDALVTGLSSSTGSQEPSYLIKDYTIHYQYSASLISMYRSLQHNQASKSFIGFAPSFAKNSGGDTINNLTFAKDEVAGINDRMGGDKFVDDDATESNFKKVVSNYDIVHLATHAILDDGEADLSRLYFSTATDSIEDGRLYAFELFNMDIPAQLVTLSACNTGTGEFRRGEGVMSLSRAFAYAGCPSIVTSLWEAQDKSTSLLMNLFYDNLSSGMAKDESLRQAKLRYINESDKINSNPFYWAGFILVGDEKPVVVGDATFFWFGVAGLFLVAAGTGIYYVRSRQSIST